MTHKQISYIKSYVRILGYIVLVKSILLGMTLLIVAEGIGIYEEKDA